MGFVYLFQCVCLVILLLAFCRYFTTLSNFQVWKAHFFVLIFSFSSHWESECQQNISKYFRNISCSLDWNSRDEQIRWLFSLFICCCFLFVHTFVCCANWFSVYGHSAEVYNIHTMHVCAVHWAGRVKKSWMILKAKYTHTNNKNWTENRKKTYWR